MAGNKPRTLMREKRHGERLKTTLLPLTYQAEEILVAKNRNFSPLVLSFIYEPDNIALRDLGTLFGTFIVIDNHEDSEYIVNCLAAAAKKEYFINSRRSVEESFESTLHKINLTLGKLVRDGHINWMGKLHGSIIAIHNREAYFSVTGEATILLLRDNILSAISEGLSDPEAALHPLKTFTDISQGSMLPGDKLILSTPELLDLLPHSLLEREATKLPLNRFAQLLKTALVNERPAAATILIDFSETTPENTKDALRIEREEESSEDTLSHPPLVENAFSNETFHKNQTPAPSQHKQNEEEVPSDIEGKEHIDNRTGHIYIQADSSHQTEAESAFGGNIVIAKEHLLLFSLKIRKQIGRYSLLFWQWIKSLLLKGARMIVEGTLFTARFFMRNILKLLQNIFHYGKNAFSRSASIRNISFSKKAQGEAPLAQSIDTRKFSSLSFSKLRYPKFSLSLPNLSFLKNISSLLSQSLFFLKQKFITGKLFWQESSRKRKIAILSVITAISLAGSGTLLFQSLSTTIPIEVTVVTTQTEPAPSIFPPADEPLAQEITSKEVFSIDSSESPIFPIVLRNKLFAITNRSIINTENSIVIPFPEGSTPILHTSAMNDLNAIFLYGQDKKMYIYYPNAKSLVENTFPIPADFTITDMGTYLTYLYAFDAKQGRILRFPRAEGGFGAPTEWLKESLTFDEHSTMAINENILIGSKNTVFSFEKGRGGTLTLSGIKTPITIHDISIAEDGSFAILDRTEKRIAQFGKNGQLLNQYFDKNFENTNGITLLSDGSSLFIAIKEKVFSFER